MKFFKIKSFAIILVIALSFSLLVPVMVSAEDADAEETTVIAEAVAETADIADIEDKTDDSSASYAEETAAKAEEAESSVQTCKIISLGDSIPAHYGLAEEQGCISQLSKLLKAKNINNELVNLAANGSTTADILKLLKTDKAIKALKGADAVTLSVGGNDILVPILNYITRFSSFSPNNIFFSWSSGSQNAVVNDASSNVSLSAAAIEKIFDTAMNEETVERIELALTEFVGELGKVITEIKTLAPDAVIYVSTVYNPINKKSSVYEKIDSVLTALNTTIIAGAQTDLYRVVDVASAFKKSERSLTDFDLVNKIYNIHPNRFGHAEIAKLYCNAMTGNYVKPVLEIPTETPVEEAVEETPVAEAVEAAENVEVVETVEAAEVVEDESK